MHVRVCVLGVVSLWLSLVLPAGATERYVVASGGATNGTCPIGTPCTLAYGLSLTVAGDTLYLRDTAGPYTGVWNASLGIPSGTEGNPVTIRGYGAEVPQIVRMDLNTYSSGTYHDIVFKQMLLDGSGLGEVNGIFAGGSNTYRLTFEDLEIRNYQYHGIQSFAANTLIFRRLHVHHNGIAAAQHRHGFYVAIVNGLIEDCVIHDNYSYGIQIYDGTNPDGADGMIVRNNVVSHSTQFGGIVAGWGDNIQIYNNVVYDHPTYGIQLVSGGSPTGTRIAHNTLYNAGTAGITVVSGDVNTEVVSNIVVGSATAMSNSGTGTTFTTNWCTSAGVGCAYTGSAGLETNPASPEFLKPLAGAGVQNKGSALASVPTDFLGLPRSGTVDLGAYEFARYVVPSGGATTGQCPLGTPCTLTYGLSLTVAGDTLYLRTGNYGEITTGTTLPNGTSWSAPITLASYPAETATFTGIGSYTVRYLILSRLQVQGQIYLSGTGGPGTGAHHVRIVDCEVTGATNHGIHIPQGAGSGIEILTSHIHHNGTRSNLDHGIYGAAANMLIQGNTVDHNAAYGIHIYNGGTATAHNAIVTKNFVHENSVVGGGGGVLVADGTGALIANNVVWSEPATGITLWSNASQALVAHNTVYSAGGYGLQVTVNASQTQVTNNVVYLTTATPIRNDSSTSTFTTNWCTTTGTGCTYTGNPGLNYTVASADFLKPLASAGIQNKGTALAQVPTDILGTARTGSVDLGAYEYAVAGTDPTVSIVTPAANPYTSPTQTVSVAGTADDAEGVGTLVGVTFTCQALLGTCTPGSGTATGTPANWSLPTLTLASGTQALVTVTATDTSGRSGQATRTLSYTAASGCTHYASAHGTGNGLTVDTPFQITNFLALAAPGMTLCLLDDIYPSLTIDVTGTAAQPITIRALNDGRVRFEGGAFFGFHGAYGILEGVNIRGGTEHVLVTAGDHLIVRRVVAWNESSNTIDNLLDVAGTNTLVEDCAAFGRARKVLTAGASQQGTSNNVVRRCWVEWSERTADGSPSEAIEIGYGQNHVLVENVLATRNLSAQSNQTSGNGPLLVHNSDGSQVLGSISYFDAVANPGAEARMVLTFGNTWNLLLKDLVAVIAPGNARFAGMKDFELFSSADSNNTAVNLYGISGTAGHCDAPGWSGCATLYHSASVPGTIFTLVPGICTRYVNGTLTSAPLWPWPMNQRITDALRDAGRTTLVDVTATIETLLGPIPAACRSDSATPVATRLVVQQQPTPLLATQTMGQPVTVQVQDENGALYTASAVSVSLALTVPAGAVLSGPSCSLNTCSVQSTSGLATFSGLSVDMPGTYTLTATASLPFPTIATQSFVVSPLPPVATRLEITQQASTGLVSTALTPPLVVRVLDQNDALFTASPVTVTISKASGGGTLGGDLSNPTVNGVATFSDLTLSSADTYTLTASFTTGTADDATSSTITVGVEAPTASALTFASVPVSVYEATNFTATVQVLDQYGAPYHPEPEIDVTIIKTAGDGTLTGGGPVTTVAGLATFSTLNINTDPDTPTTATLQASSGALTPVSAPVDVGPIPLVPTHLAFGVQPVSTYAGYVLAPVTVRLLTAENALVTDDSSTQITLTLTDNTEGATLGGDTQVAVSAGVATFSDLTVNLPGSYTLTATSGVLTQAVSTSFAIQQAPLPQPYLHWQLNEGSGGVATDTGVVPARYVGTITGPAWTTGHKQTNALSFTASEQDVVTHTGFTWPAGSPVTIVAWVKVPGTTGGGLFHVGAANDQVQTFGAHIATSENRLYWNYGPLASGGMLAWEWPTDGSLFNQWVRMVLTASGTTGHTKSIYINGQLQRQNTDLTASAAPTAPLTGLTLGMHSPYTPAIYLNGEVEDFRIYDTQWTAAQVLTDYQQAEPPVSLGSHPSSMLLGR